MDVKSLLVDSPGYFIVLWQVLKHINITYNDTTLCGMFNFLD